MMCTGHASSAVAVSLAAAFGLSAAAGHLIVDLPHLVILIAVTIGASVLPDIDVQGSVTSGHGGSTAARVFGRASMAVAEATARAGARIHAATGTRYDHDTQSGHRTITHTWAGCAAAGVAATAVTWLPNVAGYVATLAVVWVCLAMAVRSLLHRWIARHHWVVGAAVAAAGTAVAAVAVIHHPWHLVGAAVAAGCLVHTLGDMITVKGCPILWPIKIRGQRWYHIGIPRPIRFRAGAQVETALTAVFLVAGAVTCSAWLITA